MLKEPPETASKEGEEDVKLRYFGYSKNLVLLKALGLAGALAALYRELVHFHIPSRGLILVEAGGLAIAWHDVILRRKRKEW